MTMVPNNNDSPPPERVTLPDGSVYEKREVHGRLEWCHDHLVVERVPAAAVLDLLVASQRALAAAQQENRALHLVLKKATKGVNGAAAVASHLHRCIDDLTVLAARFEGIADLDPAIDSASSGAARGAGAADDA